MTAQLEVCREPPALSSTSMAAAAATDHPQMLSLQEKATVKENKKDKKAERVSDVRQARLQQAYLLLSSSDHLHILSVLWVMCSSLLRQAQQRGVKQAAPTQPDPEDPCAASYGDYTMVQSTEITQRKWTKVDQLTPALKGEKV